MPNQTHHDPIVEVRDESELGEAMLACTPAQRAFVVALVETGAQDHARAAEMAGIGGSTASAAVWACRTIRNPKVIAAIHEEADMALRGDALLGRAVLKEIALDRAHKDRFKAGVELLNRAGLIVETHHRLIVQDDRRTNDEIRKDVEGMLKALYKGRELPAMLLPPLEGEVLSSEGLEDVL